MKLGSMRHSKGASEASNQTCETQDRQNYNYKADEVYNVSHDDTPSKLVARRTRSDALWFPQVQFLTMLALLLLLKDDSVVKN